MPETEALSKGARFAEIMRILLRNEFKDMVKQAALGRFASAASRDAARPRRNSGSSGPAEPEVPHGRQGAEGSSSAGTSLHPGASQFPARVRRILEELGPTFIKIGQLLGTRPDIVPAPFIEEFKKLYDGTTPTPFREIRPVLERELGAPLETVYAYFEEEPLASASIGQVHRAQLRSGEWVAVKVQHPGIGERLRTDFQILKSLVDFTEKVFAASRVWQPAAHLREIEGMLERELDYSYEARNQQRMHDHFDDDNDVLIPKVYPRFSTGRVLTMEFVEGRKLTQLTPDAFRGLDTAKVARVITHAMAKQIFVDRLFHADPSPGNILVLEGSRVAFLDFGAVGSVTRRRGRIILGLIDGLAKGDAEETGRAIMDLCDVRAEVDAKRFGADVEKILDHHEREHASVADPVVMEMILNLARDHRMLLPPDFMLITRALYQFEGICRSIDPDYELVEVLTPFAQKLYRDLALSPERQLEMLTAAAGDYAALARKLPHALGNVLRKVERDEFTVQTRIVGLRQHQAHQRALVRLVSFSLLLAAVVVGVAIVLASGATESLPALLFVAGGVVLVWLLVVLFGSETMRRKGGN